jgi:hypothetical protein
MDDKLMDLLIYDEVTKETEEELKKKNGGK